MDAILGRLGRTKNDADSVTIKIKDGDTPDGITYVWIDGIRYCQHDYALRYNPSTSYRDWILPDPNADPNNPQPADIPPIHLMAQLTWPTNIP